MTTFTFHGLLPFTADATVFECRTVSLREVFFCDGVKVKDFSVFSTAAAGEHGRKTQTPHSDTKVASDRVQNYAQLVSRVCFDPLGVADGSSPPRVRQVPGSLD